MFIHKAEPLHTVEVKNPDPHLPNIFWNSSEEEQEN